jgi:AI-2 transport protein TqsA
MSDSPPPSTPPTSARSVLARVQNPLWSIASLVVIIWGLKEARPVLLPIVVAVMLAIICSPVVTWLEKRKVPNVAAVFAVVALMMLMLAAVGVLVGGSVSGFTESIPEYTDKLTKMAREAGAILTGFGIYLDADKLSSVVSPGKAASQAMQLVGTSMDALMSALSNTLLVVLTMVLILMEGKSVPGRLRALSGDPHADISHFESIAKQVQSYLAIKTVLSLATGVIVGVWAAILGVDFAMLWALLAFLLNYIPNIGSILAAVPAMLLALIQLGPGSSLLLGAGYVVVNMVLGNVVEPMWMGKKLGLSTTVVFLSLAIWYEIWGPVGMLLSVPLTMVIKILMAHSRDYAFVARLLDSGEEQEVHHAAERASQTPPESTVPEADADTDAPPDTDASPGD